MNLLPILQGLESTGVRGTYPLTDTLNIENNDYGAGDMAHEQKVFVRREDGPVDPLGGWTWNYGDGDIGAPIAYPEIICGKKPWAEKSTTNALPVKLPYLPTIMFKYAVQWFAKGRHNVALDLWLTGAEASTKDDIRAEIMVWLYAKDCQPAGHVIDSFGSGGVSWDLWHIAKGAADWSQPWDYFAFVAREARPEATLNLSDFINRLMTHGLLKNADAHYLSSIEFGTEIWNGEGQMVIDTLDISFS